MCRRRAGNSSLTLPIYKGGCVRQQGPATPALVGGQCKACSTAACAGSMQPAIPVPLSFLLAGWCSEASCMTAAGTTLCSCSCLELSACQKPLRLLPDPMIALEAAMTGSLQPAAVEGSFRQGVVASHCDALCHTEVRTCLPVGSTGDAPVQFPVW